MRSRSRPLRDAALAVLISLVASAAPIAAALLLILDN